MKAARPFLPAILLLLAPAGAQEPAALKALIVDGQSNHFDWPLQTRMVRRALEESGRFAVEVATTLPKGADLSGFRPKFADYDVVVSVYNGAPWPGRTRKDFEDYVNGGGGFVSVHMADNSFPQWKEYNRMIGLGGWYRRDERSGPYVYFAEGKIVRDSSRGRGGSHGIEHPFPIDVRDPEHPIMKGLPRSWMHERDELYDRLRGPAENMTVLATAFSDTATGGSGRHEPMLMTIRYGEGRVFHTTLGHGAYSRECVGFIATLQRGAEWAATGRVTLPVPGDFPTADRIRIRPFDEHQGPILSLAWAPDGGTIATGGQDGVIRLWRAPSVRLERSLRGHTAPITSLDYSRDGTALVSSGRVMQLWNAGSGKLVKTIECRRGWHESVVFSPDGSRLASAGNPAGIRDLKSGERTDLHGPFARDVAFAPDGRQVAGACADKTVRVWDPEKPLTPAIMLGHTDPVDAVAFHPDGKVVASGARDGTVKLWNVAERACLGTLRPKAGWINDIAFSPDGTLLAIAHSRLTLWDVRSGKQVATLTPRGRRVFAAAFSPDGRRLAAAGDDVAVRIWTLADVLK